MININEMRLNVWVQLADQKVIKREHVGDKVQLATPIKLTEAITLPEYYDPIPLSAEILKNCQFETDDICYWIEYSVEGQVLYVTLGHFKGDVFKYLPINSISIQGREIKYLHEVQNLIHSLTNKELIYKP